MNSLITSNCGASTVDTDCDTNTLLPIKAIFCQWERFFDNCFYCYKTGQWHTQLQDKTVGKTGQKLMPVLYYLSDTDTCVGLNILAISSIRPQLFFSLFMTQKRGDFFVLWGDIENIFPWAGQIVSLFTDSHSLLIFLFFPIVNWLIFSFVF